MEPIASVSAPERRASAWRFDTLTLMRLVAAIAVGLGLARYEPLALATVLPALVLMAIVPLRGGETLWERRCFVGVYLLAIVLECVAARIAWGTIGEVVSGALHIAELLNILGLVLYLATPWALPRRIAFAGVIGWALLIVPDVLEDGWWAVRLEREAAHVVGFVYGERLRTGQFPNDLTGYEPWDRAAYDRIGYERDLRGSRGHESFWVHYSIATETAGHSYGPERGWFYYPD